MYRDERNINLNSPEGWAANFPDSKWLTPRRIRLLEKDAHFRLIQRFIPPGSRVLDCGCGLGEWVMFLGAHGYNAEGIDYSSEIVGRLRQVYAGKNWRQGDIRAMPYEKGEFDALVSWGVIEHDPEGPGAALREFRRVLKPGGTVIVTVPRDCKVSRREAEIDATPPLGFYQYLMTEAELAAYLTAAGFNVVETGSLRAPSLILAAPRLGKHFKRTFGFRVAARLFANLMGWTSRYDTMIYCVARA